MFVSLNTILQGVFFLLYNNLILLKFAFHHLSATFLIFMPLYVSEINSLLSKYRLKLCKCINIYFVLFCLFMNKYEFPEYKNSFFLNSHNILVSSSYLSICKDIITNFPSRLSFIGEGPRWQNR